MSQQNKQDPNLVPNETEEQGDALEWTTHPMKKRPIVAILVTIFIFVVPMLVLSMTNSKLFATLALVVLFASVAKFYFPTKFILTDKQVIIKSSTQTIKKNWTEYRSFYPDKNGVLLSPFVEPSRLENFRGVYLIFADNKEEVISFIGKYIQMESDKGDVE